MIAYLETVVSIIVRNVAANGGEVYTYEPREISGFSYGYESIFTDDDGQPEQPEQRGTRMNDGRLTSVDDILGVVEDVPYWTGT